MHKIFISHIKDDYNLAASLKKWIEDSYLGQIEVFVSNSPNDIPVGKKWFDTIESFLSDSDIIIVLISEKSFDRKWIYFEAGAGWIRKIPVIPICCSGAELKNLPVPLSFFQGLSVYESNFSINLFEHISKHLSYSLKPNINYGEMNECIIQAVKEHFDEEELGYLDHIESMNNNFEIINSIIMTLAKNMSTLGSETKNITQVINEESSHPSQGTAKYIQKQSQKTSHKVDAIATEIAKLNSRFTEGIGNLEKNISFIFHYSQPKSEDEINALISVITQVNIAVKAGVETLNEIKELNKTIETLPKFEKHINRSYNYYNKELISMHSNVEKFLEILSNTRNDSQILLQSIGVN